MTDRFDPLATSEEIISGYRRYLRSLLPVREPRIAAALEKEIASSTLLTRGPLLEATPPYLPSATLDALVADGVLDPTFRKLDSGDLPFNRPLHAHQEQAIRKVTTGRNVIVATGTGSGKTESFLVPILNELSAEHARSGLGAGVRALLLYPMNALANDQMKRLRGILKTAPHITFGRYVGDTKDGDKEAAESFGKLNPGEPMLSNELLSRRAMRDTPPNLLLTNYAMLEYLLLRPADMDLFEGPYGGSWKFLVLDEAHVYDGAKAAEVAMLLRRLRDRVSLDRPLRYIATSATVGSDPTAVTEFAQRLFDAPFEWVDDDPGRQDLVQASRVELPKRPFWGPLDPSAYLKIAAADDPAAELLRYAPVTREVNAGVVLAIESRMARLRELLAVGPRDADELANQLFDEVDTAADRRRFLDALVTAGSRITGSDGLAVLSARYHLFVRATEGAYTCLSETGPHITLARHERCEICADVVFEFGACKRCGALHLSGSVRGDVTGWTFGPQRPGERRTWLLLEKGTDVTDEDDETLDEEAKTKLDSKAAALCPSCGRLFDAAKAHCDQDGCGARLLPVRRLNTPKEAPTGCLACGGRGAAMVRAFESGGDAAASVLTTSLYQALPAAPDPEQADQPGEGRKLLLFSDSRQAAAFFAPYLETSYAAVQRRRLILQGLRHATEDDDDEGVSVRGLSRDVAKIAHGAHVFPRKMTAQERRQDAALWVMQELVTTEDRQSLEGRGLIRVRMDRNPSWKLPKGFKDLGLTEAEGWDLLAELVRTVRQQGAASMPEDVDPRDEGFSPRLGPIFVRGTGPEPKRKVISWSPQRGVNRRLDYMRRMLTAIGSEAEAKDALDGCWAFLVSLKDGWLESSSDGRLGVLYQVDHASLRLDVTRDDDPVFECEQCRRQSPLSVRGICTTLGCSGRLRPATSANADDHYRYLYGHLNPVPLKAREHTAQLTSDEAADIQQQFVRGEVNALSCSTTFELGVDVGELQSVVMRNMPPTTANYVQRAGRAGRRTSSAALVVTFAQRRSHDLTRFQDPEAMVAGEVKAPYVPLGNERIDRRHAHSVALAAFFRKQKELTGETWSSAGEFFLETNAPVKAAPVKRVWPYLSPVPVTIVESLRRVLPEDMQRQIGVETGAWAEELCALLEDVRVELAADVDSFEERRLQAYTDRKGRLVELYERTINTLTRQPLIALLANRNVLPKYGFPTDTVELRTTYSGDPVGRKLELSRDLSAAIYEYAPGAEVVAGGKLWTSGGVYRLPDRALIGHKYAACKKCSHYREADDDLDPVCPSCGTTQKGQQPSYWVPQFGFVALRKVRNPGMVAPQRSWHGATYVLSHGAQEFEQTWKLANGGTAATWAGERGRLIAISEGRNGTGFRICEWCGWGTAAGGTPPNSHQHLLKDGECSGPLAWKSLAHPYETDLLKITFDSLSAPGKMSVGEWRSVLYALLEGASECLDISRDDIDGTLYPEAGGRISLVLFDTVPGGAGGALRIARSFPQVMATALKRTANCDCGEETSCYGCLRNFRNQAVHDQLSRGSTLAFLERLV
jgi:ATP-dependent helicase YprA (DUF1998 family)